MMPKSCIWVKENIMIRLRMSRGPAWLKEELRATESGIESRGIQYLLAQVQAMKEGKV